MSIFRNLSIAAKLGVIIGVLVLTMALGVGLTLSNMHGAMLAERVAKVKALTEASVNVALALQKRGAAGELTVSIQEIGRQTGNARDISQEAVTAADRSSTTIQGLVSEAANQAGMVSDRLLGAANDLSTNSQTLQSKVADFLKSLRAG